MPQTFLPKGGAIDDDDDTFKDDDDFDPTVGDTGEDDEESDEAPESDGDSAKDKVRIANLMSNWQKEQARANQLEAQLKAMTAGKAGSEDGAPKTGGEGNEWVEFMRSQARDTLFNSDPRLKDYGFTPDAIDGSSPSAMQASLTRLQTMIDTIEGKSQSKALKKHGMVPDQTGGGGPANRRQRKSYADMTDEEINREIARVKATL